ncbi:hypothetical protein [Microbacterium sp. SORGH_AS_0888]|uniref:hypothetical protein n=1 Tax=Microbacterium sp. SORGH_AS_0888 TaxID=3041791 RepID=UPI00277EAA89|nr:hypothetical protein [Microbacterium sp. SORGH_AS_0888]MDQ1130919.1 hypothetical protein [Microbacterium sp. SORGH_AS_0888]
MADIPAMNVDLVKLFPLLVKAASRGPGKNELVRNFNAYQARNPHSSIYTLADRYGNLWIREKDAERVIAAILPPVD